MFAEIPITIFELKQIWHNNKLKYLIRYAKKSLFSLHFTVPKVITHHILLLPIFMLALNVLL